MNSNSDNLQKYGLSDENFPAHVAVIMDGNGRWAKKRLLNRVNGHEKGADAIRNIVEVSGEIGLDNLTLYAFSTENWSRPKTEVSALMSLLDKFIKNERDNFLKNNIRLNAFGELDRLPDKVSKNLFALIEETKLNTALNLNLCLSYGGRQDIVNACRKAAEQVLSGKKDISEIDEDFISSNLYTKDIPDPDILIRTSGEMRLSNFMIWQLSYSELFFTKTLWPDFTGEEFVNIIKSYQTRERRFGKL
ncbi:MAG: isoprenyl transferase [Thermodesulfobacteriota bacterium]